MTIIYWLAQKS